MLTDSSCSNKMSLNSAVKIYHNLKGNRSHRNPSQHHKDSLNLNTLKRIFESIGNCFKLMCALK